MGIAMSHGPMVVSEVPTWLKIAEMDQYSTLLVDTSGTPVTFEELQKASGERYAEFATEERFRTQRELVTSSIQRLRDEVKQAEIDLVVVIGDDQWELFGDDYVPALAVYTGEMLEFTTAGKRGRYGARVGGLDDVHAGYGMDARNRWPGHQAFALHAISGLIERGFDPATINEPTAPSGLGHAFGVVECQLMQMPGALPLVPIVVNTYWPPNQMPPTRCWDLGTALREVIDSFPEDLKVAMVASGVSATSSPTRSSTCRRSSRCAPATRGACSTCRSISSTPATRRSAIGSRSRPAARTCRSPGMSTRPCTGQRADRVRDGVRSLGRRPSGRVSTGQR